MDPSLSYPSDHNDPYTYDTTQQDDYTSQQQPQQQYQQKDITENDEEKTYDDTLQQDEYQGMAYQSDVNPPMAAPYVDNPYNDGQQHYDEPLIPQNQHSRTFITGLDADGTQQQQQQQQQSQPQQDGPDAATSSLLDEIAATESYMMEYERTAQYVEAERARQKLIQLKSRYRDTRHQHLSTIQQEDIRVFFSMVAQHQDNFDKTWAKKILEHKLRADDLIDALKWKHDDQQRSLYENLRKKRMPKFSVELLNMRKRQVLLAKARQYIQAEKIKRKADMLEAIEIERIRESAKEENQMRFEALLKRQQWDRSSLANKLKIEKKCLLEAKAQDFLRLKKRLRNAEQELRKTHIRQQLHADKKLTPSVASTNQNTYANNQTTPRTARAMSSTGAVTARSSAALRAAGSSVATTSSLPPTRHERKSARELATMGRTQEKWEHDGSQSNRKMDRTSI